MEIDYVEQVPASGFLNVPNGSWGDGPSFPNTLWIQGNPMTYDGATRVCIEFAVQAEPDYHNAIVAQLYDGNTDLGAITSCGTGGGSSDVTRSNFTNFNRIFLTPSAGVHTYAVRLWSSGGTQNNVYSGANSIGPDTTPVVAKSYYRVTTA